MAKVPYLEILNRPEVIEWAKLYLKKRPRIEWYLKLVKKYPEKHPCEELKHFYSMHIPQIESFELKNIDFSEVINIFHKLEKIYLKNLPPTLIKPNSKETIDLEFSDGFSWVNLNEASSPQEGKAMGHCGNEGAFVGDTILSLRKSVLRGKKQYWEPHLTFVLNAEGYLTERKGKQNEKPHKKYHPYIVELLKRPFINGLKFEGYLPENNFRYQDLSDDLYFSFLKEFPEKVTPAQKLLREYINTEEIWLDTDSLINSSNLTGKENSDFWKELNAEFYSHPRLKDEKFKRKVVTQSKTVRFRILLIQGIKEFSLAKEALESFLKEMQFNNKWKREIYLKLINPEYFSELEMLEFLKIADKYEDFRQWRYIFHSIENPLLIKQIAEEEFLKENNEDKIAEICFSLRRFVSEEEVDKYWSHSKNKGSLSLINLLQESEILKDIKSNNFYHLISKEHLRKAYHLMKLDKLSNLKILFSDKDCKDSQEFVYKFSMPQIKKSFERQISRINDCVLELHTPESFEEWLSFYQWIVSNYGKNYPEEGLLMRAELSSVELRAAKFFNKQFYQKD